MLTDLELEQVIKDHYPEFTGIHPAAKAFPLPCEEDYRELCRDLTEKGLLNDICRTADGLLLDGRTRLMACYETNTEIRVKTINTSDYWSWSWSVNAAHRHLTAQQKAFVALAYRGHYEELAKQRQAESARQSPVEISQAIENKKKEVPKIFSDTKSTNDSRDLAGKKANVSGPYVDMARDISDYRPDLVEAVKQNTMPIAEAAREARIVKKQAKAAENPPTKVVEEQAAFLNLDGRRHLVKKPEKPVFNQTNQSVDWAAWTWNPVTGCNHGCNFCYARAIAHSDRMKEVYPFKFEPTLIEFRLAAPKNTKIPTSDKSKDGRVFVCSMADLFGKWVPDEWIQKVFNACMSSPEWEYMFLTKWPARYKMLESLPKAMFGASVVRQADVLRIEKDMQAFTTHGIKWISLEPMLEPIKFNDLSWCDVVVIGAQTATYQPTGQVQAFRPEYEWIHEIISQCKKFGVNVYMKDNLLRDPGMNLIKCDF